MNRVRLLGLIGSLVLFIGVFAPIVRIPNTDNISLFHLLNNAAIALMLLAVASLVLVLTKRYKGLWFSGAGSLILVLLLLTNLPTFLPQMKTGMGSQLAWGWGVMVAGAYLLIIAAALEKELEDSRWKLNILLMFVVLGLAVYVYNLPESEEPLQARYEVSPYKMSEFSTVRIEFPAKAPLVFEREQDSWRMTAPYKARAKQGGVLHILAIVAANSDIKITHPDLSKYGLDHPEIRIVLLRPDASREEFDIGQYNTVTQTRYVLHRGTIYLLPEGYAESAQIQPTELIDKNLFKPSEQIAGFDFSGLEQWQASKLKLQRVNGQWQVSIPNAHPQQNEIDDWAHYEWQEAEATQVEIYTPRVGEKHAGLDVLMSNGQRVHLDKLQESPELLLARPDEGLIYHFEQDTGFSMLNPSINLPQK